MTTPATHVVAPRPDGLPSRLGGDAAASAGPILTAGQPVAVLSTDGTTGVAHVELADGHQVWVEAAALEPVTTAMPVPVPDVSAVSVTSSFAKRHPPPPAPGTDAPVRIGNLRLTTQLIGGALLVVSCFLPWTSSFFGAKSAFGVPVRTLIDPDLVATTGFLKLAFVLFPLGVVVLVAGLRVLPPIVGQVAGGVAAFLSFVLVAQLQRQMGNVVAATVFGVLGIGVYLALFGGLIAAVAKGDGT